MKTYLIYKNQLEGLKDVEDTVKTVEKIAASSIHFLKDKVQNLGIYIDQIETVLARFSLFYKKKDHPLLKRASDTYKTLIVVSGNKGLVGGLWHKLTTAVQGQTKNYRFIIAVGRKVESYLQEESVKIIKSFNQLSDFPNEEEIAQITAYILENFKENRFSQVDILYPRYLSLAQYEPEITTFLPFPFSSKIEEKKMSTEGWGLPIFEPSKKKTFFYLLKKYIEIFFHQIMLQAKLSELSARTISMEHAAIKAKDVIQKINLSYLKDHHRSVTQKQLESFVVLKTL